MPDPTPPKRRPPAPAPVTGAQTRRLLKATWAITVASLLLLDITLPTAPEMEAWNQLIDRCLGRVWFEGPTIPIPGDMARHRP